ncbi:hypothetical protein CEXT_602161 [Caerostris extrusa]|uniref:Uncharacterized protein n=1 Tax=Caerostris extrusa TaxID=172846 RepID=A0AAV4T0V2_CAEEX|nr:hypothetical protein CEXT_602161 [Caerostris extrusa]
MTTSAATPVAIEKRCNFVEKSYCLTICVSCRSTSFLNAFHSASDMRRLYLAATNNHPRAPLTSGAALQHMPLRVPLGGKQLQAKARFNLIICMDL